MDKLLKFMSPAALLALLPVIITIISGSIKNRDDNSTGTDDAFANVLEAFAPAAAAFQSKDDLKFKKALEAVYITLGNYLGKSKETGNN